MLPSRPSEGTNSANSLILTSSLRNCEGIKLCCLATQSVVLCPGSHGTLIQRAIQWLWSAVWGFGPEWDIREELGGEPAGVKQSYLTCLQFLPCPEPGAAREPSLDFRYGVYSSLQLDNHSCQLWEMIQPTFSSLDFPSVPPPSQADGEWGRGSFLSQRFTPQFKEWRSYR